MLRWNIGFEEEKCSCRPNIEEDINKSYLSMLEKNIWSKLTLKSGEEKYVIGKKKALI